MHFFTSITTNYLPKARVLANTVKKHNPGATFHLVLSDRVPEGFNIDDEAFDSLIMLEDLGIPDLDSWIFKHSVIELCTAVKGSAFVKIFESTDADKVTYFDPDIVVLHNLDELSNIFDNTAVVLTPHQVEPELTDEAVRDNEICSLKHGVYNLGFLSVKRGEEGLRFIRWWRDRTLKYCYNDIPNGLFTDQRWVDLSLAFFDDIFILRDKTYNVATWNLTHRNVRVREGEKLTIDGSPIKFFHFSGFDSGAQEIMLKKYAKNNASLFELREWYIQELDKEGQKEFGKIPCAFSFYSNGELIPIEHRLLYRSRKDLISAFPQPAIVNGGNKCFLSWLRHNEGVKTARSKKDEAVLQKKSQTHRLSKEEQLQQILNSRAWKMTAPWRIMGSFIKKSYRNIFKKGQS